MQDESKGSWILDVLFLFPIIYSYGAASLILNDYMKGPTDVRGVAGFAICASIFYMFAGYMARDLLDAIIETNSKKLTEGDKEDIDHTATKEKAPTSSTQLLDTPASICEYYEKLRKEHKNGSQSKAHRVNQIITQLLSIKKMRANCQQLFEINQITSLDEISTLLSDVENVVCMKGAKRLINYYLAGDERLFLEHFGVIYSENQRLIDEAGHVLEDLAEFINGSISQDETINRIASFRKKFQEFTDREESEIYQSGASAESQTTITEDALLTICKPFPEELS
ncbi:hypothetical protein IJ117_02195 [Candidatus Saccharibacteria bacterium]|nr:hypothetical protein [Candidatus Saccharibacteria bacterium]